MSTKAVNWSYVAGFLDADGCIFVPEDGKGAVRVEFTQRQSESWVLVEIQEFLESHGISTKTYENYQKSSFKTQPHVKLSVYRHQDVIYLLTKLRPSLIVKLSKATEALRLLNSRQIPVRYYEEVKGR